MRDNDTPTKNDSDDGWQPERATLRDGETSDEMSHAERTAAMKAAAREELSGAGDDESGERYEVVISPADGYEREHAELLRKRLFDEGFYEDIVSIRPLRRAGDDDELATDGGAAERGDTSGPFDVTLPDGTTLGRHATLYHEAYGPVTVTQRSRSPHETYVRFRIEGAADRLFVEYTATELCDLWGETLHDSPSGGSA
jgi:hypothetical protein